MSKQQKFQSTPEKSNIKTPINLTIGIRITEEQKYVCQGCSKR